MRDRARPLVICLSNSWGGLEQVAAQDSLALGDAGLRTRALVLEGSPLHESLAHHQEVEVHPIQFTPRNYFDFKLKKELRRFQHEGINIFHTHQPSMLGSITPWFLREPEVVLLASRHILNDHSKKNPFHAMIYRRLDALIVMSEMLKKNVLETHPLRERQLKVIRLGLDFSRFDPDKMDATQQRTEWGADEDTIVIGLVGRIDRAKGQGTFIKAAAGLMKKLRKGEKLKFVIVGEETLGSSDQYLKELREMVAQFGIENEVVFAGFKENIPEIMRAFDVFVMPSRQEAFGLVAIEAMAMECPIVISRGGSASEIVGEEEYGLLVRPEDAFDLQRQLRHLLDNPMKRIGMGQKGREHVMKDYDKKVRIRRTLELYERALRMRGV